MNNESGSTLQKASFALLVFIAAALGYLIVRDRFRPNPASLTPSPESTGESASQANLAGAGREIRSSFAPLRPRVDTGVVRVVTNRKVTSPANYTVHNGKQGERNASAELVPATSLAEGQSTPVAETRGGIVEGDISAVTGRVTLRGTPLPEKEIQLDPMCGRLHQKPMFTRHFVVGRDGGFGNVFVYVKAGAPKDVSEQAVVPVLDNVACEFQPYVLGVRVGQPFTLRNSDPVLHNMHMVPKPGSGNREVNLGMPVKGMSVTKVFDRPEVFIKVKCDVHPWMFAYIGVVAHRWFAVTDADGNFALPAGLPPGRYTIAAVHLKAGERSQPINITKSGADPVSFTFEVPSGTEAP